MKEEILAGFVVGITITRMNLEEYRNTRYDVLPLEERRYGLEGAIGIAEGLIEEIDNESLYSKLMGGFGQRLGARHYLRDVRP